RADHARGHHLRAAGLRRVHQGGADPGARGLQRLRGHLVQRHGERGVMTRISRGRLLLNVVTGGQAEEQRRFGDHLSHDERYARTGEFLAVVRGAWTGQPFDFDGRYYQVEQATVMRPPDPVPGVYFGGSSAAAGPVAARYADTYLTWGEPPAQVAEKLAWMRGL